MSRIAIRSGLLTVVALGFVGGPVGSALGAVVFSDNFDNVSAGSQPVPQVGTFLSGHALASNGPETPVSSPNYLQNSRAHGEEYYGTFSAVQTTGTTIHAEAWINEVMGYATFGLLSNTTDPSNSHQLDGSGVIILSTTPDGSTVYAVNSAGSLVSTGLTHEVNAWQNWSIDYVVGANTYKLTIDGNSVNLDASYMHTPAASQVQVLGITTFSDANVLYDDIIVSNNAVPEPASLGLLSIGGVMVLRRRK